MERWERLIEELRAEFLLREACDRDAIQTPARIVAPDLMLDGLVAKETADQSTLGAP